MVEGVTSDSSLNIAALALCASSSQASRRWERDALKYPIDATVRLMSRIVERLSTPGGSCEPTRDHRASGSSSLHPFDDANDQSEAADVRGKSMKMLSRSIPTMLRGSPGTRGTSSKPSVCVDTAESLFEEMERLWNGDLETVCFGVSRSTVCMSVPGLVSDSQLSGDGYPSVRGHLPRPSPLQGTNAAPQNLNLHRMPYSASASTAIDVLQAPIDRYSAKGIRDNAWPSHDKHLSPSTPLLSQSVAERSSIYVAACAAAPPHVFDQEVPTAITPAESPRNAGTQPTATTSCNIIHYGTGFNAVRWLRTAIDMGAVGKMGQVAAAQESLHRARQSTALLREQMPTCCQATQCGRWCYATCPTNSIQSCCVDCFHLFVPAVFTVGSAASLCWGMVPHGCVYLAIRHEAGVSGFENVSAFVESNTTQAVDTLRDTLHWCGANLTAPNWSEDNATVADAYNDALAPFSDLQWAWMMVAPAIIVFLLLATVAANWALQCCYFKTDYTARTVAMMWCPWKADTARVVPLNEVVNAYSPDLMDPCWMQLPSQFNQVRRVFSRIGSEEQAALGALSQITVVLNVAAIVFSLFFCPWLLPAWNQLIDSRIVPAIYNPRLHGIKDTASPPLATDLDGLWLAGWCAVAGALSMLVGAAYSMVLQIAQSFAARRQRIRCSSCCSCCCCSTMRVEGADELFRGLTRENVPAMLLGIVGFFVLLAGCQVTHCSTSSACDLPALNESVRWTLRTGMAVLVMMCLIRCVLDCMNLRLTSSRERCCCGCEALCLTCHRDHYRTENRSWVSLVRPVLSTPSLIMCWTGLVVFSLSLTLSFVLHPSSAWGGGMLIFPVIFISYPFTFAVLLFPSGCALGGALCSCKHDGSRYSEAVRELDDASHSLLLQLGSRTRQSHSLVGYSMDRSTALGSASKMHPQLDVNELEPGLRADVQYAVIRCSRPGQRQTAYPQVFPTSDNLQQNRLVWTPSHVAESCRVLRRAAEQPPALAEHGKSQLDTGIKQASNDALKRASNYLRLFDKASVFALRQASLATREYVNTFAAEPCTANLVASIILRMYVCIEMLAIKLRSELGPSTTNAIKPHQPDNDSNGDETDDSSDPKVAAVGRVSVHVSRHAGNGSTATAASIGIIVGGSSRMKRELLLQIEVVLDALVGAFLALNRDQFETVRFVDERSRMLQRIRGEIELQQQGQQFEDAMSCSGEGTGTAMRADRSSGAGPHSVGHGVGSTATAAGASIPCSGLDAMEALRMARSAWSGPASWPRASTDALIMATWRDKGYCGLEHPSTRSEAWFGDSSEQQSFWRVAGEANYISEIEVARWAQHAVEMQDPEE